MRWRFPLILAALTVVVMPLFAHAAVASTALNGASTGLDATYTAEPGTDANLSDDLPTIIGEAINLVLGAMGVVLVILLVYAGILYVQGGLDEANIKKAKKIIIGAVIGLVLVVAAYAITQYIVLILSTATAGTQRN